MKRFFFIAMLGIVLSAQGQVYRKATDRKALKSACEILKVYYPSNLLCIEDSIYDLNWYFFTNHVDEETRQVIGSYRQERKFGYRKPVYSKLLHSLSSSEQREDCKYVARFSSPNKGLIMCEGLPTGKNTDAFGSPGFHSFLFQCNDKGEIDRVFRILIYTDHL